MSYKAEEEQMEIGFDLALEWVGMPEFVQKKKEPYKKLIVRFETEQEYKDFSDLIGQKLTTKTKSIWHPFKSHWGAVKKVYKDDQ